MQVLSAYQTDAGRARELNEDYVWIDQGAGIYIIADGLGGHDAGDVASLLAATQIGPHLAQQLSAIAELDSERARALLTEAIERANSVVWAAASQRPTRRRSMGAVIVAAIVRPPIAYIAHAGDARAYLLHAGQFTRRTEDDSLVATLIAIGHLTPENARTHPRRHVVTKVVGQNEPVEPALTEVTLDVGDWLLLCSDGLWSEVEDGALASELAKHSNPWLAASALTAAANAAGGQDNVSVIAIRVTDAASADAPAALSPQQEIADDEGVL